MELTCKADDELEDLLLDLCGRLTLNSKEVELLQAIEEERERRFANDKWKITAER